MKVGILVCRPFSFFRKKMVLNDTIYISYYDIMEVIKMDYKYFITEITTSNRLVFKENATTAVKKENATTAVKN